MNLPPIGAAGIALEAMRQNTALHEAAAVAEGQADLIAASYRNYSYKVLAARRERAEESYPQTWNSLLWGVLA